MLFEKYVKLVPTTIPFVNSPLSPLYFREMVI